MTAWDIARTRLLDGAGLSDTDIAGALATVSGRGEDLADVYIEQHVSRSWQLDDGQATGGGFAIEQGLGLRSARGSETSFAHTADLRPEALREAARTVRSLLAHGDARRFPGGIRLPVRPTDHGVYEPLDLASATDAPRSIELLERIDRLARAADERVVRVDAVVSASDHVLLVATADWGMSADVRPIARLSLTVMMAAGGRRAHGTAGIGVRHSLDALERTALDELVARAVRIAAANLDARASPVGVMPVVLAAGYPGVLFHEAVGHGLEGDHHRKRISVFSGMMGERVALPGVTVIDDGSLPGRIGSFGIDDEGVAGEDTVLVKDGILTDMLQDRLNAGLMNSRSTGNGRRQSYAHLPMPRMTNTFLAAGKEEPADIIRSVTRGLYVRELGGGQVDIRSGRFNFSTTEAWLIEDGRLTAPVSGATLIGVGHETLKQISMVGHDLAFDAGEASCGKAGQTLDVGVGQPTIRLDAMMVGGVG